MTKVNTDYKIHSMDVLYERQETILKKLDMILSLLSPTSTNDVNSEDDVKPKKLLRKNNNN